MKFYYSLAILLITSLNLYSLDKETFFIENKGQIDNQIDFYSTQEGLNILVDKNSITYDFFESEENIKKGHVISMTFQNSNSYSIKPGKLKQGRFNFLKGSKDKWIKDINIYENIILDEVYNGIDLNLKFKDKNPRYDFILEPFASPDQIRISFKGMESIEGNDHSINLNTTLGTIKNSNLFAYQVVDGKKQKIECSFHLDGNEVSFKLGQYDKSKELIIDPTVLSTYIGSPGEDEVRASELFDNKYLYLTGYTTSEEFETTDGAYQVEYIGERDAFVSKYEYKFGYYNLVYTTLIGSLESEEANDIVIQNNQPVFCGITKSPDYPTANTFSSDHKGGYDMFVTKLNEDGNDIVYSTIYGGQNEDIAKGIEDDKNGNIYIAGYSNSPGILTSGGPQNNRYRGGYDIFFFSNNKEGDVLRFSSYTGGTADDKAYDIYVDFNSEEIYLTGYTISLHSNGNENSFPIAPPKPQFTLSAGPYDDTQNGGKDAFAMHLSKNASNYIASTFLGGDEDDIGKGIYGNDGQQIYIIGESVKGSEGLQLPITPSNSIKSDYEGPNDLFIAKFDKPVNIFGGRQRQDLLWCSLLGTRGEDFATTLEINPNRDNLCIAGYTNGKIQATDPNAEQKGGENIFYYEVSNNGTNFDFSTAYGTNGDDRANDLSFDSYGNPIIGGYVGLNDLTTTKNAVQSESGGLKDGFIARYSSGSLQLLSPSSGSVICRGREITINWNSNGLVNEDGFDIAFGVKNDETDDISWSPIEESFNGNTLTYTIPEDLEQGSKYFINISHPSGIFVTNETPLEVKAEPQITSFSANGITEFCEGENLELNISATGEELQYTWFKDGSEIPNETGPSLIIQNTTSTNSGDYKVNISGFCPPGIESEIITITVFDSTKSGEIPNNLSRVRGSDLIVQNESIGNELEYQWQKNGEDILGQTSSELNISNIADADEGEYRCIVRGTCGTDTSNVLTLEVELNSVEIPKNLDGIVEVNKLSNSQFNISILNNLDSEISIVDMTGNAVLSNKTNNNFIIDLTNYSSGIYWIIVNQSEKVYKFKILNLR